MHNPSPPPPPPAAAAQAPPQLSEIDSISIEMFNEDDDHHQQLPSSAWDWTDFLDFDPFTNPPFPITADLPLAPEPAAPIAPENSLDGYGSNNSDKVRKRDPRLVCSNFLAGRVPCACPELDAKLAEMEEEEVGPGKKRARTVRVGPGGFRCQVPGCGVDISELKGYHKRHKVCLGCANATTVFIDGETKRYCQQCGKFHILSDFDEGKRSCRRKLERHNNRRRRKSTDFKGLTERDSQSLLSAEDVGCDDETLRDTISLNNQEAERETLVGVDRPVSLLYSAPGSLNIQSDSGVSPGASGETQCDEQKEKCDQSPSCHNNKTAFSSVCPTGRISFKLYDWNPAEFPRRLRHQIFQWLASMPVELEGYVRPGCTILTVFIAMPNSMWVKLSTDPVASIRHLVTPANMLFGKGSFYVYLNNVIYRVLKDGTSVMKVRVKKEAPKLHYVHPTCFEAGKPMEFLICGDNLLQPKFRFLVSFAGKYLSYDNAAFSSLNNNVEDETSSSEHQLLKISVPHTELNLFGPAFVEVENESGVSNFIPILIGDEKICIEMNMMQHKLDTSLHLKGPLAAADFSSSCDVFISRQKYFSEFILDVAWLLKDPDLEHKQQILTSLQIQRFNGLLEFIMENQSLVVLERVASCMRIIVNNSLIAGVGDADMKLYKRNIDHVDTILSQKIHSRMISAVPVIDRVSKEDYLERSSKVDMLSSMLVTNQDIIMEKNKFRTLVASKYLDNSETAPLLNAEVIMSVNHSKEQQRMPSSLLLTNTFLPPRPLIFLISAVAVCFGICAIVFHPQKVGEIAVTIRRCLFDHS